jgi:chromosome segregation ATPase
VNEAIVSSIVAVGVAAAGGPHLWRWLVERRRVAIETHRAERDAAAAERAQVEAAESRLLLRFEARVSHLEDENARLHEENRVLVRRLDEKTREVEAVRAAYSMLSEQHALLAGRVKALETTVETLNATNARALERAIMAAIQKRDTES